MIESGFNYQPLQTADYSSKLPLDFLTQAMGQLQQRSDRNYMAAQELPNAINVPVDEADFQRRAQIESGVKDKINKLLESYNGDYSNASKDVYALQSHVKSLLSPSGQLGAMANNYGQLQAYQKNILDDKTLSNTEKDQALRFSRARFKELGGTGEVNPVTGQYNTFQGHKLTGFDMGKYLKDFTKIDPIAMEQTGSHYDPNTGYFNDVKTGLKINDPNRISNILKAGLMANTDFQEWAKGRAQMGLPVDENTLNQAIGAEANGRASSESTIDSKFRFNEMLNYKLKAEDNALARAKFAHELSKDSAATPQQNVMGMQYIGITGGETKPMGVNDLITYKETKYNSKTEQPFEVSYQKDGILDFNHPNVTNNQPLKMAMMQTARNFMNNNNLNVDGNTIAANLKNPTFLSGQKFVAPVKQKPFDEQTPEEQNKTIQLLDTRYKGAFRQALTTNYNDNQTRLKNGSIAMMPYVNDKMTNAMAANAINNLTTLEVYDPMSKSEHPMGTLEKVIKSMDGDVGRIITNGILTKKGDVKINYKGASDSGDDIAEIQVMGKNGTEIRQVKIANVDQTVRTAYKLNVVDAFGTKDVIFDPWAGVNTNFKMQTNIEDNAGRKVDIGNLRQGVDKNTGKIANYLRINDNNNFRNPQKGDSYRLDDGNQFYFTKENIDDYHRTGQISATLNANGQIQPLNIQFKAAAIQGTAATIGDIRFNQNLDNKEYKDNTSDINKIK